MKEKELKIWNQALKFAKADQVATLFEESDKYEALMVLFRKAASLADKESDPEKARELKAYSEGFRHALNIMAYRGDAMEAYRNIINPGIKVDVTDAEMAELSVEG